LRVPFLIRWPGKIPAGNVSNEIVHEMDLFMTLAAITGGKVPTDRVIDGVDQSSFFLGKQDKSNRNAQHSIYDVQNTLVIRRVQDS
jgi:arylsulfatase